MPANKSTKKDRYPGIRSFEADDERLFYGRNKEIDDLLSLVMIKPLLVLFGKSGLGKSSLLKAGLGAVLLRNHFFPIMIRVQDTSVSPVETVLSELSPFVNQEKLAQFGGKSPNQIWECIKACRFTDAQGHPATPVLIFDQFEELFNHDKSVQSQWAAQLADLIEGRLPKDAIESLQQIPRRERTSEQLAWFEPPAVKILFAIRSDRMSELHQLRYEMPAILQNRYELKALQSAASSEAIEKPAALIGAEFATQPFTYAPKTVQEIQKNLSNEAGEIESFQLQIVCQHIEEKVKAEQVTGKENIIATSDFLGGEGGIQFILKNYYDNHIKDLGSEENQLAARRLLEEGLIADGRRIGVADAVVKGTYGIDANLLEKLMESRLIRPENTRLGRTYEISHDTLVAPIMEALEKRKSEEEKLAKQKELEERERQLVIERRKRRISTLVTIGAVVLSLLAIGSMWYALGKQAAAVKSAEEANEREQEAKIERDKNKRIIDALNFYGDSLALASRKQYLERTTRDYLITYYGFINKKGITVIGYQYSDATPFDNSIGFATVKKANDADNKYFLGPDKKEYLLANSMEELTSEITALDLRDQKLTSIPSRIFQFPQLKILLLSNTQLSSLPREIGNLVNLEVLDLGGNELSSLPQEIGNLVNLEALYLSGNKLSRLPGEIENLVNLESLYLSKNQLSNFPGEIGNLVHLKSLDLNGNQLSNVPKEIGNLVNLKSLYLSGNQLSSVPSEIGNLVNLVSLGLRYNQLTSLPNEIGNLVNLESLDLGNNQLSHLPKEIEKLVNLESLYLKSNQLSHLPQEIGNLVSLELLNLTYNQLTGLPDEIGKLVNLEEIHLKRNPLSRLPTEIGNLVLLKRLDLNENLLSRLPKEIGNLVNLEELYLNRNPLSRLPKEIGNLVNLKDLRLGENENKMNIPKEIGDLINLEFLYLGYNQLSPLPKEIGNLINLKFLSFEYTRLSEEEEQRIKKLLPNCDIIFNTDE